MVPGQTDLGSDTDSSGAYHNLLVLAQGFGLLSWDDIFSAKNLLMNIDFFINKYCFIMAWKVIHVFRPLPLTKILSDTWHQVRFRQRLDYCG